MKAVLCLCKRTHNYQNNKRNALHLGYREHANPGTSSIVEKGLLLPVAAGQLGITSTRKKQGDAASALLYKKAVSP